MPRSLRSVPDMAPWAWRTSRPRSAGEFAGLVAEEGGFDEGADDVLFVGVELVEGGEVVFEGTPRLRVG